MICLCCFAILFSAHFTIHRILMQYICYHNIFLQKVWDVITPQNFCVKFDITRFTALSSNQLGVREVMKNGFSVQNTSSIDLVPFLHPQGPLLHYNYMPHAMLTATISHIIGAGISSSSPCAYIVGHCIIIICCMLCLLLIHY